VAGRSPIGSSCCAGSQPAPAAVCGAPPPCWGIVNGNCSAGGRCTSPADLRRCDHGPPGWGGQPRCAMKRGQPWPARGRPAGRPASKRHRAIGVRRGASIRAVSMGSRGCASGSKPGSSPAAAATAARIPPPRRLLNKRCGPLLVRRRAPRVWALDAARVGLKVWSRRRWCPRGLRPPWVDDDQDAWRWRSAAVEPTPGDSLCLLLPGREGAGLEICLRARRQAFPAAPTAVGLDHSGAHTRHPSTWPRGSEPVPVPASSPELNPGERGFKALREPLSTQV
jgi:hypothetical protein